MMKFEHIDLELPAAPHSRNPVTSCFQTPS